MTCQLETPLNVHGNLKGHEKCKVLIEKLLGLQGGVCLLEVPTYGKCPLAKVRP